MSGCRGGRRRTAAALAAVLAASAAGGLVATAGGAEAGRAPPIEARADATPREHYFADRVDVRVDVTVDRAVVDPDGVRLLARFAPYRRAGPIDVARRDVRRTTVLSFTTSLQCIDRACLGGAEGSRLRLPPAVVQYFLRADPTPVGLQTTWPELTLARRLPPGGAAAPVRGRTEELPDVSYRIAPTALGLLLAAVSAALVLGAAAAAALRLRPRARPRARPPVEARRPPTLESLLALVEQAPDEDARRVALDMLARALSSNGPAPVAERVRRLAWASPPPPADETRRVTDAVRRSLWETQ